MAGVQSLQQVECLGAAHLPEQDAVSVHAAAFNLGLLMRRAVGVGTPRGLQGRAGQAVAAVVALWTTLVAVVSREYATALTTATPLTQAWRLELLPVEIQAPSLTTGC